MSICAENEKVLRQNMSICAENEKSAQTKSEIQDKIQNNKTDKNIKAVRERYLTPGSFQDLKNLIRLFAWTAVSGRPFQSLTN